MLRVKLAITLYEKYVFRVGTILAITIASGLIFLLRDSELVWGYSSLLVALAYAIAAMSSFRKFRADMITAAFPHAG
jgi:hypothetical protein